MIFLHTRTIEYINPNYLMHAIIPIERVKDQVIKWLGVDIISK